jgi:hypothetical protein
MDLNDTPPILLLPSEEAKETEIMSRLTLRQRLLIAGLKAGQRVQRIYDLLGVEVSELFSLGFAFAWAMPLAINGPAYLSVSPNLQHVARYVPYPWFLSVMVALFAFQLTSLVLGGLPSAFISSPTSYQRWRAVRCVGLYVGAFVWFTLAFLLTSQGVTTGTFLHGFCGVACGVGIWRFDLLRLVDVATDTYRAIRAFAAEEEESQRRNHRENERVSVSAVVP